MKFILPKMSSPISNGLSFFLFDFNKTLFPLETNKTILELGQDIFENYLKNTNVADLRFLQQQRVYAAKHGQHLRRTFKLDPFAEFFVYDLVYKLRGKFRGDVYSNRRSYGFRFSNGSPITPLQAHHDFKKDIQRCKEEYEYAAKFDVSSYFNSLYHHDLETWFRENIDDGDYAGMFGSFLRQINSGRTVDCLPHGLMPTKIIGSHFLSYIDNNPRISSQMYCRFMDDFFIFSNEIDVINRDFLEIQKLLGDKGLSVNPSKTEIGQFRTESVDSQIEKVRRGLLGKKRGALRSEYIDGEFVEYAEQEISEEENQYLLSLLGRSNIEEEDAELVLAFLKERGDDVLDYLKKVLWRFPYLIKNIYLFSSHVLDKSSMLKILIEYLKEVVVVTEYSLFWVGKILEKDLLGVSGCDQLVKLLLDHPCATDVSKSKILEIRDRRYGLREYRESFLRDGASKWMCWSSAVGMLSESKTSRNHMMKYMRGQNEVSAMIADILVRPN